MTDTTPYGKRQASVEFWSNNRNTLEDLYPSEKYFFADRLPDCRSVLDVGCAAGGFSEACRELRDDIEYTGLDVSPNLVNVATRKYADARTRFSAYDGREFPEDIRTDRYDMVYSFGVLHHVPHWAQIVEQMVHSAAKYVCFDLRLSFQGDAEGFQIIDFNEEWDGETKIDYVVVDFFKALSTVHELLGNETRMDIYGYESPPTSKAEVERDKVIMASFCLDKTAGKSAIMVEIS